jgi:hypothetical protein
MVEEKLMSIYATLWEIKIPRRHPFDKEWVEVFAQAVPPHIGHPSEYPEGDLYADFLPPVVEDYDPKTGEGPYNRAVVIVQKGRDKKDVQRYVDPLIVMTGKEYAAISFAELLDRIYKAVGWDDSVVGVFYSPTGEKKILRSDEEESTDGNAG